MPKSLLWIALLIVAVRALLFLQLGADPRFDQPDADMAVYHDWAIDWSNGDEFVYEPDGAPFWRSPAYPLFLSWVYRLVGTHRTTAPRSVAVFQMLLGAVAAFALSAHVFRRWGPWAAWSTALLMNLHGPLIYMEAVLLPVGLALPLLSFAGLCVLKLQEETKVSWRLAVIGGLLAGLAAVLRPNLGLVLPIVAVLLFLRREHRRASYLWVAAAALPLLACLSWNLQRSGEWVVTGANGPMNLYFAYGEHTGPTFDVRDHRWGSPQYQRLRAREIPIADRELTAEQAAQMSDKEISRYWADKAFAWMKANPGVVLQRMLEKTLGVLTWRDLSVNLPIAPSRSSIWILWLLWIPYPLVLFLGLFGALRLRNGAATAVWIGFVPILIGAVMYFTYTRFRVPSIPLLAVAAGPAVAELRRMSWNLQRIALIAIPFIVLVAASWNPWLGKEARRDKYWNTTAAHGFWQKGTAWHRRYRESERKQQPDPNLLERAIASFEHALELQPNSPLPHEWIAVIERDERGNGRRAYEILAEQARIYPPSVYPNLTGELAITLMRGYGPQGVPNYAEIDRMFLEVERYNGMAPKFLGVWADALYQADRLDDAIARLEQLLATNALAPQERQALEAQRQQWLEER